jgi:hypothetical protein
MAAAIPPIRASEPAALWAAALSETVAGLLLVEEALEPVWVGTTTEVTVRGAAVVDRLPAGVETLSAEVLVVVAAAVDSETLLLELDDAETELRVTVLVAEPELEPLAEAEAEEEPLADALAAMWKGKEYWKMDVSSSNCSFRP